MLAYKVSFLNYDTMVHFAKYTSQLLLATNTKYPRTYHFIQGFQIMVKTRNGTQNIFVGELHSFGFSRSATCVHDCGEILFLRRCQFNLLMCGTLKYQPSHQTATLKSMPTKYRVVDKILTKFIDCFYGSQSCKTYKVEFILD